MTARIGREKVITILHLAKMMSALMLVGFLLGSGGCASKAETTSIPKRDRPSVQTDSDRFFHKLEMEEQTHEPQP
ncbi:MAG: hypothetical protein D6704_06340 [Nitrospirae bacterium]|nr:MAG: hypothetical protein D6704_06340 [Nitrospirota bacterium]